MFGGGMQAQGRPYKALMESDGPQLGTGASFGNQQGNNQDLGSVQSSGRPPGGPPKPGGGGLGYAKLLGNLMKEYNPMQQGRFG